MFLKRKGAEERDDVNDMRHFMNMKYNSDWKFENFRITDFPLHTYYIWVLSSGYNIESEFQWYEWRIQKSAVGHVFKYILYVSLCYKAKSNSDKQRGKKKLQNKW